MAKLSEAAADKLMATLKKHGGIKVKYTDEPHDFNMATRVCCRCGMTRRDAVLHREKFCVFFFVPKVGADQ